MRRCKGERFISVKPNHLIPNLLAGLVLVLWTTCAQAQAHWDQSREIGLNFGTSYYIGDLNPSKHFGTRLQPGAGLTYRENIDRRISIKGSFVYNRVEAYDADSDDPWQQNRNLHFRNDFMEGSVMVEINFWDYQIGTDDKFTPYLTGGLAYYSMEPQAEYNGVWYDLQPLGTEGQGTTEGGQYYTSGGFALPFGAGFKLNVAQVMGISLEWSIRKTWTDHFDDVSGAYADPAVLLDESGPLAVNLADRSLQRSGPNGNNAGMQRGDPGRDDWYAFAYLSLNFRLDKLAGSCFKNIHFH